METKKTRKFSKGGVLWLLAIVIVVIICFLLCQKKDEEKPIRIGWQTSWATQGQLAEILQKTNIPELFEYDANFNSFTYGAPLSEAALAGQIDVAFVGDQPAITLLSKSTDWKIVGRLMNFRVGIVVPINSPIKSIKDLKGKTLAIPFGSSTHRVALEMIAASGLDTAKDVKVINVSIASQNELVKGGAIKNKWHNIDAFASWDPSIANFEDKHWARILTSKPALGVIMMSNKYLNNNQKTAARFLQSFRFAYYYYSENQDRADQWFATDAQGQFDVSLLNKVASIEPNLMAKKIEEVNVTLTDSDRVVLQKAADFAYRTKLITTEVDLMIKKSIVTINETSFPMQFRDINKVKTDSASKK